MLYDEASLDRHRHLSLPMPTMEQLASHSEPEVSGEVRAAILDNAANDSRSLDNGEVNPYWVHAVTHQVYRDVTIGQVARVLLDNPTA